jgi:hypothetical protein
MTAETSTPHVETPTAQMGQILIAPRRLSQEPDPAPAAQRLARLLVPGAKFAQSRARGEPNRGKVALTVLGPRAFVAPSAPPTSRMHPPRYGACRRTTSGSATRDCGSGFEDGYARKPR